MSKYLNKTKSHISFMPRSHITAIVVLVVLGYCYEIITCYIFALIAVAYVFINRIVISPEGIKYKHKFFKWDAINTIGIAVNKTGVPSVIFKTLYISLARYDKPVQIVSTRRYYYDNQYNRVPNNVELETDEDYIIKVSFNRRLIQHILAYWDADIVNLNDTIGWKSYMKLYNMLRRQHNN